MLAPYPVACELRLETIVAQIWCRSSVWYRGWHRESDDRDVARGWHWHFFCKTSIFLLRRIHVTLCRVAQTMQSCSMPDCMISFRSCTLDRFRRRWTATSCTASCFAVTWCQSKCTGIEYVKSYFWGCDARQSHGRKVSVLSHDARASRHSS